MSGFRRHIMAKLAQRQFIEGYCNVYNDTYTFNPYINGTRIAITVNTDANGYWRHTLSQNENITSLNQAFIFVSQAESDKLTSIKFNVADTITSLQRAFGYLNDNLGCTNLVRIDGIKCDATIDSAYENSFSMCSSLTFVDVSQLQSTSLQSVSTARLFNNCRSLVTIDGLSTFFQNNKLYRATGMFADCRSLSSIDTTYLDMQYCEYAYNMFLNCHALTSLDVSAFNLSNCTRIDKMFQSCINLTSIDITNWNVSLVTDATNLIYGCDSLTSIGDVSGWDTHSMTRMYRMFANAPALISNANNTLDCSSWDTSALTVAIQPNQTNGFRQFFGGSVSVTHLGIPTIKEGVTVVNMFANLTNLTTITACGNIYAPYDTLSFSACPLDLNSAKLILSKLQNTNGNSATLTFSSTTKGYINNDQDALALVANAVNNLGWTIALT